MWVEDKGYERFERKIDLPGGRREPIDITLVPVELADVSGRVTLFGDGRPLAGVRISLRPADVKAASQGSTACVTSWDGEFSILDLPAGEYALTASSPGCGELERVVSLAGGANDLPLELARIEEETNLRVTVTDAVTGSPISGAKVTLAEAWPKGVFAEGSTTADGSATFAGIQQARLNWTAENASLSACGARGNARAEAEGYLPGLAAFELRPGSVAEVKLFPLAEVEEAEPNSDFPDARQITLGSTVKFSIPQVGDQDFFRFRLEHPSRVKFDLPGPVIDTALTVFNSEASVIRNMTTRATQQGSLEITLPPGEYFVCLTEWGDNASSEEVIELRTSFTPVVDPGEPNDSSASAKVVRSGEETLGYIFPTGDVDVYRFSVDRPGYARVLAPPRGFDCHMLLFDERGAHVAEGTAWSGNPIQFIGRVSTGSYELHVYEWGNNAESLDPYSFRIEIIEDDLVDDPPGEEAHRRAVRSLPLNSLVGATILPEKDTDSYSLGVPGRGVVHMRARAPFDLHVFAYNRDGVLLGEGTAWKNNRLGFSFISEVPQEVNVVAYEWGHNAWATSPYTISAWWEPADELDLISRNDTANAAVPVEIGEVIRGSILPLKDIDCYSFFIDHPGVFELSGLAPVDLHVFLYDSDDNLIGEATAWKGNRLQLQRPLLAGSYYLAVYEWGDNGSSVADYELTTKYFRADPLETEPLRGDPVRTLKLGEAQPVAIEHVRDVDRFAFTVPQAGPFTIRVRGAVDTQAFLYNDQTGEMLGERTAWRGNELSFELEAGGPTRYRLEVCEWGENNASLEPGYVLADTENRGIVAEKITSRSERTDPTSVVFTREAYLGLTRAERVELDADGDGRADLELGEGETTWRYGSEGVYQATAFLTGADGVSTVGRLWVDATGPRERTGVHLTVNHPAEGRLIERDEPVRLGVISYSGAPIAGVTASSAGRVLDSAYSAPFELRIPWASFEKGEAALTFTAADARGETAVVTRKVRISEYFNLMPSDGSVHSGAAVRVSWRGRSFGTCAVRYRPQGQGGDEWREITGESGLERAVVLKDIEAGTVYEFQPLGGGEPGPLRTLTRVKGLSFGRTRYGVTIKRDYDQRVGISVRNNSDNRMTVMLESGSPPAESLLVVDFVSEGSVGKPFELGPGEEREFVLSLNAQDVVRPLIEFPVRIRSDEGFSDEAEIEVNVKLPEVKLEWQELGEAPGGLGKVYRLQNTGDALTDLAVYTSSDDTYVVPRIGHGLLPSGRSMDVTVYPVLHEEFQSAETRLFARGLDKEFAQDVKIALPEGLKLHNIFLSPGYDPYTVAGGETQLASLAYAPLEADEVDPWDDPIRTHAILMASRALIGDELSPRAVDWEARQNPTDSDGDGRIDQWERLYEDIGVRWIGRDTDGDGAIDYVRADVGDDGVFDLAASLREGDWQQAASLDSWLEMKFSLPYNRSAYEKHDVDLVLNGTVVGKLRDTVPEGNHAFRFPSTLLRIAEGETNELQIRTKHMRGGHYVVNSDIRISTSLAAPRLWQAARSPEEARARLMERADIDVGPDFSIASPDVRVEGPEEIKAGESITLRLPVRNIGAGLADSVAVGVYRAQGAQLGEPDALAFVHDIPAGGSAPAELVWKAVAGNHQLRIVVNPEQEIAEKNTSNNEAVISVGVAGDTAPPELEIISPRDGAELMEPVFRLSVEARDDAVVEYVKARVDNELEAELTGEAGAYAATALLQPGEHTITVTVADGSENRVERAIKVVIVALGPAVEIREPAPGATIEGREARVVFTAPADALLAAVRVNGGAWRAAAIEADGTARATAPMTYGEVSIEAMCVDRQGVATVSSIAVRCTAQRSEESWLTSLISSTGEVSGVASGTVEVEGLGRVDMFERQNHIVAAAAAERRDVAAATSFFQLRPDTALRRYAAGADGLREALGRAGAPVRVSTALQADSGAQPSGGGNPTASTTCRDWYCTNRPDISMKVGMPYDIMKKNAGKSRKEIQDLIRLQLARLKKLGFDVVELEKFRQALLRKCRNLSSPEELPGWLESFGLWSSDPDPTDLTLWRQEIERKTDLFLLMLLSQDDPAKIAWGLRDRMSALNKYDEASAISAEAAVEMIHAHQKLADDMISGLPVVGDAVDLIAAVTGENLAGDKLGAWERIFRAACVLGPLGIEETIKRWPAAREAVERFAKYMGDKTAVLGEAGMEQLKAAWKKLGGDPDKLDDGMRAFGTWLTKERHVFKSKQMADADEIKRAFINTPEGKMADETWQAAKEASESKLHNLDDVLKSGDDAAIEKALLEFQSDKLAQQIAKTDPRFQDLADGIQSKLKGVYNDVDDAVKKGLQETGAVDDMVKKYDLDPDSVRVQADEITGRGGKLGADRDVTYRVYAKDKSGKTIVLDIDHDVAGDIYAKEFYKRMEGDEAFKGVTDPQVFRDYAQKHDHLVTSGTHPESYLLPQDKLDRVLAGRPVDVPNPKAINDTIVHKSETWFEQASHAAQRGDLKEADRLMMEGMRQANKNYDRLVVPQLQKYGIDATNHIPTDIQTAMDIFRKVESTEIAPETAMKMLKALGDDVTPNSVVKEMGKFFEETAGEAAKNYRLVRTAELAGKLNNLTGRGAHALEGALNTVNEYFTDDGITQQTFHEKRGECIGREISDIKSSNDPQARQSMLQWSENAMRENKISREEYDRIQSGLK